VRQVGAALDSNTFHPGRSAAQHLKVIATAAGLPHRRVGDVLDQVGLSGAAGRKVGGYSLGMRQRLSLAGALLGDPGVLILDEPLNGLDPEGIRWMRGLLRSLATGGRTVLVSSHLLTEVAQTVDEVVVLAKGRLIAETTLADLTARSSVIRARTTDATRLADVLLAAGIQVRLVDGTTVEARGADGDAIGLAAAGAGLPILELSRHDEDLETLFFDLVNDKQEVAA
jgi:ABC-2 type transport system ATP-binding protein